MDTRKFDLIATYKGVVKEVVMKEKAYPILVHNKKLITAQYRNYVLKIVPSKTK